MSLKLNNENLVCIYRQDFFIYHYEILYKNCFPQQSLKNHTFIGYTIFNKWQKFYVMKNRDT